VLKAVASSRAALLTSLCAGGIACALAACGSDGPKITGKVRVTTSFYPLQEAAQKIGGNLVQVTDLTPLGGEPHDLEPAAAAVQAMGSSNIVFSLGGGFQPAVEKAVAGLPSTVTKVDVLSGEKLLPAPTPIAGITGPVDGGAAAGTTAAKDPHVWVDPPRFMSMVKRIEAALIELDPDHEKTYQANATAYLKSLQSLGAQYETGLANCQAKTILTAHAAFGYLAQQYGLTQAAFAGITPVAEPDPSALRAIKRFVTTQQVKTLFFETALPKKLATTVEAKTGASVDVLRPVEGLTSDELAGGATYVSVMTDNLHRLEQGLACTPT
jgi:zinc transport system substrate-binding protein